MDRHLAVKFRQSIQTESEKFVKMPIAKILKCDIIDATYKGKGDFCFSEKSAEYLFPRRNYGKSVI